ncbi:50S ribosomal protein L21e [Saccharolobus caldissimus]|uniref:Large ribosomal subunit protein eL21 n=1 Tax=Saccharolobus caldissimus TaxID=1702097 RepID=A0AAQ4CPF7_9CREN|nr:50S ribosomal protein L21e [Saccharolobus caldissimus]BDB97688.1 50S ribosomal protein L21e [Saccharolobus caldissimus]
MVKHSKGYRTRSRSLLRKNPRERGAIPPLSRLMYEYKPGDYVVIKINSSVYAGMPHRRYQGKVGRIIGKRGRAYEISVKVGSKEKILIVRPEHLSPFNVNKG